MKKNIYIILLFLVIISLFGCEVVNLLFNKEIPHEYNPQKAGADIAARIILSGKPHYISYANSHCYILNDNNISVYDLTNDRLSLNYTIPFNINVAYHDESGDYNYSINKCSGLLVMGNTVSCILSVVKQNKRNKDEKIYLWNELSVRYDAQTDKWSEVTSGILSLPVETLDYNQTYWYDNSCDILYAGSYGWTAEEKVIINQFQYNTETQNYINVNSLELILEQSDHLANSYVALYFMHDLFLVRRCNVYGSGDSDSYLYFYPHYQTNRTKKIHLDYLHIFNQSYSVFYYDNGNIWLYHQGYDEDKKQNKYELLKLKLL